MKLRKVKKYKYLWILVLILINSLFLVNTIGKKATANIDTLVIRTVNKNTYDYIFHSITKEIMSQEEINQIIYFNKNKEEEIVSIEYRMNVAYAYLNDVVDCLYDQINQLEIDSIYYDKEKKVFFLPIGYFHNNIFFSHLGSKVPCKVELLSNVKISFKTKVRDYGINTLLIEFYLDVETIHSIINPLSQDFGEQYEILLSSKIVNGKIPTYYGGVIEKSSQIVTG